MRSSTPPSETPAVTDPAENRLNRLAGSGQGWGGGLPLPALFSAMLNEVLDNAPVSDRRMTEITSSALNFKRKAVFATWPSWEALTADVLAQMESAGIIRRQDSHWVRATGLVVGQRLEIIPARPHLDSRSDGVTVWTKDEREARSRAAHAALEANAQAAAARQRAERMPEIAAMIRQERDLDRDLFLRSAEAELGSFPRAIREQNNRLRELLQAAVDLIERYERSATLAVTERLCACGCTRPVTSPRPEARYATSACRVRAHRAR